MDGEFFAAHTVTELNGWNDFDLENQGRITEPLSYDPDSDKYLPITWDDAYALVGDTLRGLAGPHEASFYTSGRLSNEATFLYQLWVREFGTNNMPDCSNMCHEASGRALTTAIGTGKGTCDLDDWESADLLILMAVNAASNAPRMLTSLAEVAEAVIRDLAGKYMAAQRTIIAWCLGLTQQEHSVDTMREIINLLLLRGNIGRPGAGPSSIRGHSNVQGNRTCGVNHHPTEEWLAKHDAATGISSPRAHGLGTVATIEAMAPARCRSSSASAATSRWRRRTPRPPSPRCATPT